MTWHDDWHALSARIDGLTRSLELMGHAFKAHNQDLYGITGKFISPEIAQVFDELRRFQSAHAADLPKLAGEALRRFLQTLQPGHLNEQWAVHLVVPFAVFQSEFEFLLRDRHHRARSLTELAFEHLRRTLVVDDLTRQKWVDAFEAHETHCEKLGAIHLLSHGVWAFKVAAIGAATDLVFGDPVDEHALDVRRTARAMVLTEWKRVTNPEGLSAKIDEARAQIKAYREGALADLALTTTRYIVLVSRKALPVPPDLTDGSTTYRHIALAVDPDPPSLEAQRRKGAA